MKFFRLAGAFCTRRREGPHRFALDRSPAAVSIPQGSVATKTSKSRLSRDFRSSSIFEFCNSIGATRTWRGGLSMSAVWGRTDMPFKRADFRVCPTRKWDIRHCSRSLSKKCHLARAASRPAQRGQAPRTFRHCRSSLRAQCPYWSGRGAAGPRRC